MDTPSPKLLRRKENDSIYLIRETVSCFRWPALLWSTGKDSTVLLHIARKSLFGKLPFPVIHIDTGNKFPEMYEFRDHWAGEWNLDLIIARNQRALDAGVSCCVDDEMSCCHQLKTIALQQVVSQYGFDALMVGIRRDEHGIRAKERYFSPRGRNFRWDYRHQPVELLGTSSCVARRGEHIRVHPLLHWTELDIWCYVQLEGISVNRLYFARNGRRYRSLGCQAATKPFDSDATSVEAIIEELRQSRRSERADRAQDKESAARMQRLRALGYM